MHFTNITQNLQKIRSSDKRERERAPKGRKNTNENKKKKKKQEINLPLFYLFCFLNLKLQINKKLVEKIKLKKKNYKTAWVKATRLQLLLI